jgi:uroporphyrin-III C-methyltransferase / precorrin-2 dehydrogenase / sirohydrochlorin ferrochelatase
VSQPYPLGLLLNGRRVLVVGGGSVATRRIPALLAAGAQVDLVAVAATPALTAMADAGRLRWYPRPFTPSDVEGAWLVHVAVDDREVAAQVSAAAEAAHVFCVRADDRHAASAWTPAVTRHGPVTVAVLGGGDPRRAVAVRDALRDHLAAGALEGATQDGGRTPGVALVGAGPGDPELITVRGRRLLAAADVVVVDRLATGLLLDELRPGTDLVEQARAGRFVVRLKGGDPYVFGRGGEEVLACAAAGVPVTVVPGVSSALAVPAAAGIPVTHRGVAHELVVVSGHLAPDDPASLVDWAALGRLRGTVCVLMGLANLAPIVAALVSGGRPAGTPAAAVQEGTTAQQRVVRAPLAQLPGAVTAAGLRSPTIVVIGAVVDALAEPPEPEEPPAEPPAA